MNPNVPPSHSIEPLDTDERRMARALRSLPSALPPAELDARILGASRRAIALTPKPRSQRGWAWGLSSAAVAVLALGVLTKMHLDHRDAAFEPTAPVPTSLNTPPVPAHVEVESESAAAADVEQPASANNSGLSAATDAPPPPQQVVAPSPMISEPALAKDAKAQADLRDAAKASDSQLQAARADASATTARKQEELQNRHESDKTASDQAAARNGPQPFPAAAKERAPVATGAMQQAPIVLDTPVPASKSASGTGNAAQPRPSIAEPTPTPPPPPSAQVGTFAPPPAKASAPVALKPVAPAGEPHANSTSAADEGASTLNNMSVVGSRVRQTPAATLPAVDTDAKLPPAQWIERIRQRVNAADGRGARESLRQLLVRYPQTMVPTDLAPLRQ